jgi:hypothetical protein
MHGSGDLFGNGPPGDLLDQNCDFTLRQITQRNGSGVACQGGNAPANLGTVVRLNVAIGSEQDHAAAAELTSQELEEKQRRFVRPLEVVEENHERLDRRMRLQDAGHRIEEAKAREIRIEAFAESDLRQQLAQLERGLPSRR